MLQNDALDELTDLGHRWQCLLDDVYEETFDYDFFKLLAAHTFSFLFRYRADEVLPRDMLGILFRIAEFASYPVAISRLFDKAQLVAESFCLQLEEGWVTVDGAYSEEQFVVFDRSGDYYLINTDTFDLAPML